MADEHDHKGHRETVPPVGEQIHLPGPSYLPVLVALGLSLAIIGVVISLILVTIGVIVLAVSTFLWVREAREEMAELPLSHGE